MKGGRRTLRGEKGRDLAGTTDAEKVSGGTHHNRKDDEVEGMLIEKRKYFEKGVNFTERGGGDSEGFRREK